jgi:hypothetical protein
LARRVAWTPAGGGEIPYHAEIDGARWRIRINDFPAEPLYTLLIGESEIGHFDEWPKAWDRP